MASDPRSVDLSFRGLALAHGARLERLTDGGAFVAFDTPLPVGSRVAVKIIDGAAPRAAQVVGVVELEAGGKAQAGMQLAWVEERPAVEEADEAATTLKIGATAAEPAGEDDTEADEAGGELEAGAEAASPERADPGAGAGKRRRRRRPTGRGGVGPGAG